MGELFWKIASGVELACWPTLLLVDASNLGTPERGFVRAETTGAADRKGIDGGAQDLAELHPTVEKMEKDLDEVAESTRQ